MTAAYLLESVSWTGMSEFKAGLAASRTIVKFDIYDDVLHLQIWYLWLSDNIKIVKEQ